MDSMLDKPWTTMSGQPNPVDREFIGVSDILAFLRLYARSIVVCFLLGILGAAFYAITTDRIYTARAQILIDPKHSQLAQQQGGEVNLSLDTAQIESQIAVMTSEKIAMMVITQLDLLEDPRFNRPPSSGIVARVHKAGAFIGTLLGMGSGGDLPAVGGKPSEVPAGVNPEDEAFERTRLAMWNFQSGLSVRRMGVSYALEIQFSQADPELASQIANALADAVIREQLEEKATSARQGGDWLEKRLRELRIQMNSATQIAQEFRARHDYSVAPRQQVRPDEGETDDLTASATEPTLEELETTADTYRKMYESFLQAYASSVSQQSYPVADARLITPASRPLSASHPRPKLAMAFGGLLGIMLGLGLATLRHMFDRTVRGPRQVREELALECIGELPSVRSPYRPEELRYPHTSFSYSLRKIRTAISLSDRGHPVRRIGITSTQNCPDKHALVCSLATLYAAGGLRVLVIDADLQRPGLEEWLCLATNWPTGR